MSDKFYEAMPMGVINAMMFGLPQRLEMYEMLASLTKGGTPIDAAIRRLWERKSAKKKSEAFLLNLWHQKMKRGLPFSKAIEENVPSSELALISAGEMSDDLRSGLLQAIDAARGARDIKAALVSNMSQPCFLLLAVFFTLFGFSKYMAPDFAKMLREDQMTGSTGELMRVSKLLVVWWPLIVGVVGAIGGTFAWSLPRWTGAIRNKVDDFIPYSIYRSYTAATFMLALSALLKSDIPLDSALRRIKGNAPPWLKEHIGHMLQRMVKGIDAGTSLDTGLLDSKMSDQLYVYAQSPDFGAAIKEMGDIAIKNGIKTIQAQAGIGKLVALVMIGATVSWIQLSLFDIEQKISEPAPQVMVTQK